MIYNSAFAASAVKTLVCAVSTIICMMYWTIESAQAQLLEPVWDDQFAAYGVDGEVLAAAYGATGDLYIAGEFSRVGGLAANSIAVWDGFQWSTLGGGLGDGFSGLINAIAISGDGSVYIGGDFFEVIQSDGSIVEVENLAKWNGSAWENIGTGVDGPVHALAINADGTMYIGGEFSRDGSGEFELSKIAAWDGSNLATVGNGLGTFSGVVVRTLDFDSQGDLYAGGTELSGGIFRWDGQVWNSFGARHSGSVNSIKFDDQDNLYVGGDFQSVTQPDDSDLQASRIARWNGQQWETVGSGLDAEVTVVGMDDAGTLHVGGLFSQSGDGTLMNRIARWNSVWEEVGPGGDENLFERVNAFAFMGNGSFYALGDVQHLGGALVNGVGYWNGEQWNGIGGMGVDDDVQAVIFDSNGILHVGGAFVYGGPVHTQKIARWVDHTWETLGNGVNGNAVFSLDAGENGMIYVGGDFSGVLQTGGMELQAYNIAAWDGATWSTFGTGVNGTVEAVLVDPSGNVYIGGAFTQDGSNQQTLNYVAMWDGASWSAPGGGLNGPVHALSLDSNGQLLAGGSFTEAGGIANTSYIARWNGSAWEPISASTALDAPVRALYLDFTGTLYAGGEFTQVESGLAANFVASWTDAGWNLLGSTNGNGVSSCCVNAISSGMGDDITVGGDFIGVINPVGPDLQANGIASWKSQGNWKALKSGLDGDTFAIASNGEDVIAGGSFQVAGGLPSAHIARWSANELLVSVENESLPSSINTSHIYPNPALHQARIDVTVDRSQDVVVEVFDVLGRKVGHAYSGYLHADQATAISINRNNVSSGLYIVRVRGEEFSSTRKLIWLE